MSTLLYFEREKEWGFETKFRGEKEVGEKAH